MKRRIIMAWVYVFFWMMLIFFLSSLPGNQMPQLQIPYIDKLLHLFEYAVLGKLLARALHICNSSKFILLAVLIGSFYGLTDELHQFFVPYREPSFFDFIVDVVGGIIGAYIYAFSAKKLFCVRKILSFFNFT